MAKSSVQEQEVFSRLIDYLVDSNEMAEWRRYCWRDGCNYHGDEIDGRKDNEFSTANYDCDIALGEIQLKYIVHWEDQTALFRIHCRKYAPLNLDPLPEDIVLFSHNPYSEERKTKGYLPIFQARYQVLFVLPFDEANVAMRDFVDNGERLETFFINMRQESIEQFRTLVGRFKQYRDVEGVVRVG